MTGFLRRSVVAGFVTVIVGAGSLASPASPATAREGAEDHVDVDGQHLMRQEWYLVWPVSGVLWTMN